MMVKFAQTYTSLKRSSDIFKIHSRYEQIKLYRRYEKDQNITETTRIMTDDSILKFISVRHPIERILSAYRDKYQMGLLSHYIYKKGSIRSLIHFSLLEIFYVYMKYFKF